MDRTETKSNAEEVFIRACATWLNVIGQLAKTKTADAGGWAGSLCWELERYIEEGLKSVQSGEVPGDQLPSFCETETWRDLAIAVAMGSPEKGEGEFPGVEDAGRALEAVRTLHLAYEYHSAGEERRIASYKARVEAAAAALGAPIQ